MPLSTPSRTQLKEALIAQIPKLRAFAMSLSGNSDLADDLVQETLVKAWKHLGSFNEGTNLPAWLFTILRNVYFSQYRKRKREVEDTDGVFSSKLTVPPAQTSHMEMLEFRAALAQLPANHREALLLVGAVGHSYVEAAEISGCAVGTIKSRVNRARRLLAKLLSIDSGADFCQASDSAADESGPDNAMV